MFRRQPIIDIENNHVLIESANEPFAIIMVDIEAPKHPSTPVEIDIGRSRHRLAPIINFGCRLEDANSDLSSFHGALLFRDSKDIGPWLVAIEDSVLCRVLAILFYRHFMSMQASNIVLVVVLDVDRVKPGQKLFRDGIVKRLSDFLSMEFVQSRITTIALLLSHFDLDIRS